jgi:hypothetical protein
MDSNHHDALVQLMHQLDRREVRVALTAADKPEIEQNVLPPQVGKA